VIIKSSTLLHELDILLLEMNTYKFHNIASKSVADEDDRTLIGASNLLPGLDIDAKSLAREH
jgi:hypothetical protein